MSNINESTIQFQSPNQLNQEFRSRNWFLGRNNFVYREYTNISGAELTITPGLLIAKNPLVLDSENNPTLVDFVGGTNTENFFGVVAESVTLAIGETATLRVAESGGVNKTLLLAMTTPNPSGYTNTQNYPFVEGATTNMTFSHVTETGRKDNEII